MSRLTRRDIELTTTGLGGAPLDASANRNIDDPSRFDSLISVKHVWDDNSRLIQQVDDNGNVTQTSFDDLNRPLIVTNADSEQRVNFYDRDHNAIARRDENGSTVEMVFDAINRSQQKTIVRAQSINADGDTISVGGTTLQTFGWDGRSRMTSCFDNNDPATLVDDVEVVMQYSSLDQVLIDEQRVGPRGVPSQVGTVRTAYDGVSVIPCAGPTFHLSTES